MCRTVAEITEDHPIVKRMDRYISANGNEKDTLLMEISRHNFISSEQNNDNVEVIMEHITESDKSRSLTWLLKNKTLATATILLGLYFTGNIVFQMIMHFVPLQKMIEGLLP